jgi:hypothetical protein
LVFSIAQIICSFKQGLIEGTDFVMADNYKEGWGYTIAGSNFKVLRNL